MLLGEYHMTPPRRKERLIIMHAVVLGLRFLLCQGARPPKVLGSFIVHKPMLMKKEREVLPLHPVCF